LAQALAQADLSAVLEALASDVVLLPVVAGDELGSYDVRAFTAPSATAELDLLVFSSAETFDLFLGESPDRLFVLLQGAAVVEWALDNADLIEALVFDAAGPHPLRLAVSTLNALVEVSEVEPENDIPEPVDLSGATVTGFDVPLPEHWGRIDLLDAEKKGQQIKRLVKQQLKSLGEQGATVRYETRAWLRSAADRAASQGGSQMAFLLAGGKYGAASLSMVVYYHDIGSPVGPQRHIDRIATQLASDGTGKVAEIDMEDTRIIRHEHLGSGAPKLGAEVELLLIDYWIDAPDERHLAHVSFSTPHVDAREAMIALMDNVVFSGHWVLDISEDFEGDNLAVREDNV
jgi:hypothetical protein